VSTTEHETHVRAKVRGALPGEQWREYVSAGAERAYDAPLAGARAEAKGLRRKGRLVAAHKREQGAYKIRVRGWDRKYQGRDPLDKAYTSRSVALGPVKFGSKKLQLRKPTKAEERAELVRAVAGSGVSRLVVGVAGGAAVTDAMKDAQARKVAQIKAVPRRGLSAVTERKVEKMDGLVAVRAELVSKGLIAAVGRRAAGAGRRVVAPATGKFDDLVAARRKALKGKAMKYGGIAAAGTAASVAAGTAAGNVLSPRR
jgi:hypothetical protein